jgi:glutamyl-tRNA reductase
VRVIGLDQLSQIVQENLAARQQEIPRAEQIIAEELNEYQTWLQTLQIQPTVLELRSYLESLAEKEMGWIRRKESAETAQVVEKSLRLFIGKLLQRPVQQLKAAVSESDKSQDLESLQRLFQLSAAEGGSSERSPADHSGIAR